MCTNFLFREATYTFVQHVYVKKDMNTKKTCLVETKQKSKMWIDMKCWCHQLDAIGILLNPSEENVFSLNVWWFLASTCVLPCIVRYCNLYHNGNDENDHR
jgi:hypothetical protein